MAEVRQLDLILKLKDEATKSLDSFSGKLESMQPTFQKMAAFGTAALIGIGFGIKGAVGQAVNLGESINAVEVVFGEGAKTILEFGKTSAKAVGMANSEFNQMATITGALLKDTGKPMSEVSDMTVELTKRAADMASVFNTDVNDAMGAINQAIRGETEAIRRYAGDVTDATLQTYLNSKGINKNVTELTQQEKRLYRVDLIMQQTAVTANDFQNTSESLANQQRILTADFKNISATIGETFIPIIQDAITAIKPVIEKVAQWIKDNPELTKNIILASLAIAGLVAVVGLVGLALPAIIAGFGLLLGPLGLFLGILALLAPLIIKNKDEITSLKEKLLFLWDVAKTFLAPIFKILQDELGKLWKSVKDLWSIVSPVLLPALKLLGAILGVAIVIAILGVIAVITTLASWLVSITTSFVNFGKNAIQVWDSIKETITNTLSSISTFFSNTWTSIKNTITSVWGSIVTFFTNSIPAFLLSVVAWFADLPNKIAYALGFIIGKLILWVESISSYLITNIPILIDNIVNFFVELPGKVLTWLVNTGKAIAEWAETTKKDVKTSAGNIINSIITWFSTLPGKIGNALVTTATTIIEWFVGLYKMIIIEVPKIITGIINFFKELPGKMLEIGKNIIEGLKNGIMEKWRGFTEWMSNLTKDFIKGIKDGMGIHSPSKVMAGIGDNITMGLIQGIKDGRRLLSTTMNDTLGVLSISPDVSNILQTTPSDFSTNTPALGSLVGVGGSGGVNVVINYPFLLDRNAGDILADVISDSLRNKLRI